MAFITGLFNKLGVKIAATQPAMLPALQDSSSPIYFTDAMRSLRLGAGVGTAVDLAELQEHAEKRAGEAAGFLKAAAIVLPVTKFLPKVLPPSAPLTISPRRSAPVFDDIFEGSGDFLGGLERVANIYSAFRGSNSSGLMTDSGDPVDSGGGEMTQVALPGAIAAGGIWLGTYLARAFGRGVASSVFTAANGIRVRIAQLWPLVRKYGPANVAGALGISVGALGTMLAQAPTSGGGRRRRRGVSASDVRTTRRTIKQLRGLSRLAGIGGGGGRGRAPRRRSYRYC